MFQFKDKQSFRQLVAILLAISVAVLTLSIFTEQKDGRRQILDGDGGTEEQLCSVLSSVKGAGQVNVMVEYNSRDEVTGVIVLAEGGGNPVVANNLTKGVSVLYGIPASSVIVFEKNMEEKKS